MTDSNIRSTYGVYTGRTPRYEMGSILTDEASVLYCVMVPLSTTRLPFN